MCRSELQDNVFRQAFIIVLQLILLQSARWFSQPDDKVLGLSLAGGSQHCRDLFGPVCRAGVCSSSWGRVSLSN